MQSKGLRQWMGCALSALRARIATRHTETTRRMSRSDAGMTLIEIMVVVAIIGLLMGTVGIVGYSRFKKASVTTTKSVLVTMSSAVETYLMDNNGDCPKDLEELYAEKIINKKPKDAWGQPLIYKCPGDHNKDTADIVSKGPDKKEGTEDDLKNWQEDENN